MVQGPRSLYAFHPLSVPKGCLNARPEVILGPKTVVGMVDKPAHHCLYQTHPVIWTDGQPSFFDWPDVGKKGFAPTSSLVTGAALVSVEGQPAGRISGYTEKNIAKIGFVSFGVIWDLDGKIVQFVDQPGSRFNDLNARGDAVGTITYRGKRSGIIAPDCKAWIRLDQLCSAKSPWTVTEALRILDQGEILVHAQQRQNPSATCSMILVPEGQTYRQVSISDWFGQIGLTNQPLIPHGLAKLHAGLCRAGKIASVIERLQAVQMTPSRIRISAHQARPFRKVGWCMSVRPGQLIPSPRPARMYIRGNSAEGVILAAMDVVNHPFPVAVLIAGLSVTQTSRPLLLNCPDDVSPSDPLIIGSGGHLAGQCRANDRYEAYLASPILPTN